MTSPNPGAFAPLRERVFLILWVATVAANVGTWMRDTASGWLMTSLAPSPTLVALVQAATTLPVFLLALPAGALSDIVDRRRLMIVIQIGLAAVSLALGVLTQFEMMTPYLLLALTFCGGIGAALAAPAWQSIVPELVPRNLLRPAVALNSLGTNIARAIGPALGGLIIATVGTAMTYYADVASYALIIGALVWWPRSTSSIEQPERLAGAMRAGIRFAWHQPNLQRVLLRAFMFFIGASCYWALLPLIVRVQLRGDATAYGLSMTAIGCGAIVGALLLPRVRQRFSSNTVVVFCALLTAAMTALLAVATTVPQGVIALFFAGLAWIAVLTLLNASAQSVLPNWVRGRGLALYLTVFFGSMTLGSFVWGSVASAASIQIALMVAAAATALLALLAHRWSLPEQEADLTPSMHWPEPALPEGTSSDAGPVMVRIVYNIAPERHEAFRRVMTDLGHIRRRDGAYAWGLMFNSEQREEVSEWFLVESWEEHLRQHRRIAKADRDVQARAVAFHQGPQPPRVEHHIDLAFSSLPAPGPAAAG